MILHKTISQFCDDDIRKNILFNLSDDRPSGAAPKLDYSGNNEFYKKEGYTLVDLIRTKWAVEHKDYIQKEIKDIFGKRTESMFNNFVLQKQKYYEHILRPQIDEIVVLINIESEDDLKVKLDGEEFIIKEDEAIFLSDIKSDRIIFMNQSEKQIFQIFTAKQSKAKSLL